MACPQDSTASASSLVSAMLILERIVSTNSLTEFIEARKEGSVISSALLQARPSKFTGNLAYLHTSPSSDTLAPFPRELKKSPVEDAQLLSTQISGRCSQYILQLWYRKGILQQNKYLMWVHHLQFKSFPLLIDSSRNALYIHRGSEYTTH